MYMLVAFLALLAFLSGNGGKSAKNVECAKEGEKNRNSTQLSTNTAKQEHKTYNLEQL